MNYNMKVNYHSLIYFCVDWERRFIQQVTKSDIFFNWNALPVFTWKGATLKTLIEPVYLIFSKDELWNREPKHTKLDFYENNSYPQQVIKQVLRQISEEHNTATNGTDNTNNIDGDDISFMNNESATFEKKALLVLSYQG